MFRKNKSPLQAESPEVTEIIYALVQGEKTPEEAAAQLGKYWFPSEELRSDKARFVIQTRQDSMRTLDNTATALSNQGEHAGARRLAEMNWILAQRSADQRLMTQCAATLAQLLVGDPSAADRRLALLEFCVPEVLTWDHIKGVSRAVMLANLADARYMAARSDPHRMRKSVQTVEQALEMAAFLDEAWLCHLYMAAGTLYNDLAESEDDLRRSVECNEKALSLVRRETDAERYASVLNNLGNSCRDLGARTRDARLLEKAIDCYDKALPYRSDPRLRLRTQGNKTQAQHILEDLRSGAAAPLSTAERSVLGQVKELVHAGDDMYFASSKAGPQQQAQLRSAADYYLQAMKLLGCDAPPKTRAEILHRLATLFVTSTDDDELWTGLCFASATRRLGQEWRASSLASVDYHRGQMLVKIGFPDQEQYLRPAETLLRQTLPVLKAQGRPGEYEQASKYLEMCLDLLDDIRPTPSPD